MIVLTDFQAYFFKNVCSIIWIIFDLLYKFIQIIYKWIICAALSLRTGINSLPENQRKYVFFLNLMSLFN